MKCVLTIALTALLVGVSGVSSREPARQCRHDCRDAVHQCMAYGMHQRRCQRSYWHACSRVGPGVCFGATSTSTTTTLPAGVTTTTSSLPPGQGSVHLSIAQG